MKQHPRPPGGTPAQSTIADMFGPLDGAEIPGGCNTCNAFQTVAPIFAGAWQLTVHHDGWCPTLAAMRPGVQK